MRAPLTAWLVGASQSAECPRLCAQQLEQSKRPRLCSPHCSVFDRWQGWADEFISRKLLMWFVSENIPRARSVIERECQGNEWAGNCSNRSTIPSGPEETEMRLMLCGRPKNYDIKWADIQLELSAVEIRNERFSNHS